MAAMKYLSVEGVSKAFGFVPALSNISFSADRGETVCFVGENGAGKSTLLRCVAALNRPDTGKILISGENVFSSAARRTIWRQIGVLEQEAFYFYEDLTCFENLELFANLVGTDDPAQLVLRTLERVGLSQSRLQSVRDLSGGMRKRLALGRLLLQAPKLLVLDEPFAHLDDAGEDLLLEVLEEFRGAGVATVFASHRLELASRISDRVIVLEHGRIVDTAARGGVSGDGSERLIQ